MEISKTIQQLFDDSFLELMELLAFQNKTREGYNLIEERHVSHMKSMAEQIRLYKEDKGMPSLINLRRSIEINRYSSLGDNHSKYVNTINRSIIIYACSIFDNFLNQTIKSLLLIFPIKLSTEKNSIPYHEFILNTKEKIIESLIEKEIYEWSYKRIDERIKDLSTKFELDFEYSTDQTNFFSNQINLIEITRSFAIRNIIVHNKGIVNKLFIKNVPDSSYLLGETISIDTNLIANIVTGLINTTSCITRQVEMRYN